MNDAHSSSKILKFPDAVRVERQGVLNITRALLPLLEAALAEGNAELLREVFAVLGDVADGRDAEARLAAIRVEDATVVLLKAARSTIAS